MFESIDGAYGYVPGDPEAYFEALQNALEDNAGIAEVVNSIVDALPIEYPSNVDF